MSEIDGLLENVLRLDRPDACGVVRAVGSGGVTVAGLRAGLGDLCRVELRDGTELPAEVVGFDGDRVTLMPFANVASVTAGDRVIRDERGLDVPVGMSLLGRVVDPLGRPLDGGPPIEGRPRGIEQEPPSAWSRAPIEAPFSTGVAAIDGLLTLGKGQRVGLFSGAGVGKSRLLGSLCSGVEADVRVVALIGERGREVREFVEGSLSPEQRQRTVVVAATSDQPAALRRMGAYTAASIAESFREAGLNVFFAMDSVTRFAAAIREIGMAAGEPPVARGYPPSLYAELPRLIERLGNDDRGSITAVLTVLVDGDDLEEPVADAVRGLLDGHIILDRDIAATGRFPAINVLRSISRVMDRVIDPDHARAVAKVRTWLARLDEFRDLVRVGAYRRGGDSILDEAMDRADVLEAFLAQAGPSDLATTRNRLIGIAGDSAQPLQMPTA